MRRFITLGGTLSFADIGRRNDCECTRRSWQGSGIVLCTEPLYGKSIGRRIWLKHNKCHRIHNVSPLDDFFEAAFAAALTRFTISYEDRRPQR